MSIDYFTYLEDHDPEVARFLRKALEKPTSHPEKDKPASINGLPAPDNKPGPGRGNTTLVSKTKVKKDPSKTVPSKKTDESKTKILPDNAKTAVRGGSGKEIVYLSKKDFPKAPNGTIGSTENSWKVPAGIGRQLKAKEGEQAQQPTNSQEASQYNKKANNRETVKNHLKEGDIASKKALDGDNASSTFKVVIQGNGSGIMKPQVNTLKYRTTTRSKIKPQGEEGWKFDSENEEWVKDITEDYDIYAPGAIGSFGSGNITPKKNVQREVAAHFVSSLCGLDLVPVTVMRNENGEEHSVQQWREGFSDINTLRDQGKIDPEVLQQNDFEVLKTLLPKSRHKELEEKLMDIAVFDIIINNNDRHGSNFIVNSETGDLSLIDHGFAFCNSMHGNRNHFLHNTFHGNKPIKMSSTMLTRLKNQSFNDYKRSMPGLQDWEQGQAFLRSRYVSWLQENHGHIDRQKFLHTMSTNQGIGFPGDGNNWGFSGESENDHRKEYIERFKANMLPFQLFESWSKAYINEVTSNPDHPDFHDISEIDRIGCFMESGFPSEVGGVEGYRSSGKHREYERDITPSFDIPKSVFYHMETLKANRQRNTNNMLRELNKDNLNSKSKPELQETVRNSNQEASTKVEKSKGN